MIDYQREIVVAVLAQRRWLLVSSHLILLLSFWQASAPSYIAMALLLWLASQVFHFRVALDQKLLTSLPADKSELKAFDHGLKFCFGRQMPVPTLTLEQRCKGMLRLFCYFASAITTQLLLLLVITVTGSTG